MSENGSSKILDHGNNDLGIKLSKTKGNEQISEKAKFNRLFWHSRRGMLELDLLLIPFLKEEYRNLSESDQAHYERLLECEDPDLFQWFLKNRTPEDPDFARIVKIILNHVLPS